MTCQSAARRGRSRWAISPAAPVTATVGTSIDWPRGAPRSRRRRSGAGPGPARGAIRRPSRVPRCGAASLACPASRVSARAASTSPSSWGCSRRPGPVNWEIARQIARSVALGEAGWSGPPTRPHRPSSRSSPAPRRPTSPSSPASPRASARRSGSLGPSEWADLHLTRASSGARSAGHHPRRGVPGPDRVRRSTSGEFASQRPARRTAPDARARAARAPGRSHDRVPRPPRARPLRPAAAHGRHAEPVLRRPSHRRLRDRVEPPPRRPALLPRRPRSGPRGDALGAVGAQPARAALHAST